MWAEYVDNGNAVLAAARRLSGASGDESVSAAEVAEELRLDESDVLAEIVRLAEMDWFTTEYVGPWPPPPGTKWNIRKHPSLTNGKRYEVLGIEADDFRILNDQNDPVLFDPSGFRLTERHHPSFWKCETGEEGEYYCGPARWMRPGFFEDYHDGNQQVRQEFWSDVRELYPATWQERRLS